MNCGAGAVTSQVSTVLLASCSLDSLELDNLWGLGTDVGHGKVDLGTGEVMGAGFVGRVEILRGSLPWE